MTHVEPVAIARSTPVPAPVVPGASRSRPAVGAAERDRAAYAAVFREHRDAVLRVALLLCGDRHRAEEATAEAFAKVWPHWRRGHVLEERAYLCRAVVNELRSRGRRRQLEAAVANRRAVVGAVRSVEDDTVERSVVLAALARLPERQRAAVVLRYYEDLSEAQTAEALGMRLGTVKSQTARGLARLRELLAHDAGGAR
jgi:RNA polymerase sigma-70 factor (sigma-E family)